jgi:hypothetical protein
MLAFRSVMIAIAAASVGFGLAAAAAASGPELHSVQADGTEFKVALSDGRVLRSRHLAGAVLTIAAGGGAMRLRIDAVERDPDAKRGEVWLHTLSVQRPDGSWQNLCEPGLDGRRQGFPVAGRVRQPDGIVEAAEPGVFELTCTAGAQGKCVRFGYLPWESADMRAHYNACIRMVRGDYCGDGEPHTRDGTLIDLYDKPGIQTPDSGEELAFEAAWGAEGAVCVRRVRIPEMYSLDALRRECPRFKPEDLGEGCTEQRMRQTPATLLMNRSRPK